MFACKATTLNHFLSRQDCRHFIILLFGFIICSLCESAASEYATDYGSNLTATATHLRFHDFEPRTFVSNKMSSVRAMPSNRKLNFNRLARGIHFYSTPEDLVMEMEFIIPFVKIPIERSTIMSRDLMSNLMNLNSGALLSTGVIVAVGAAVAGVAKVLTTPQYAYDSLVKKQTRSGKANEDQFSTLFKNRTQQNEVLNFHSLINSMDLKLKSNDLDATVCMQQLICRYFSSTSAKKAWRTSSFAKIIEGLINLEAIRSVVKDSAFERSFLAAKNGLQNCGYTFRKCKWSNMSSSLFNTVLKYLK